MVLTATLLLALAGSWLQAQRKSDTKRSFQYPNVVLAASADLDQCRNGTEAAPEGCYLADKWVNGNANHVTAHWSEYEFIAYRMKFDGLTLDSHTVTIGYDFL